MFVVCFFVYLSACFWCLDYSRTNEQIFIKNLWVGPGERKKLLIFGKDVDHILDTKKSWIFIGPISMYFNDFSFLLHISSKVINKFWCQIWSRKGLAMGRSDYSLGKIQLIYWIPRSLQNFWKCHHDGCVLYFITLVRLVTSSRAFCSLWVHLVYIWDEEKQFHCVFPIRNKKNSLLTLIFKQITPNLEESVCTPWNTSPPNLRLIDVIVFEL